jgi:hypothetical protein
MSIGEENNCHRGVEQTIPDPDVNVPLRSSSTACAAARFSVEQRYML